MVTLKDDGAEVAYRLLLNTRGVHFALNENFTAFKKRFKNILEALDFLKAEKNIGVPRSKNKTAAVTYRSPGFEQPETVGIAINKDPTVIRFLKVEKNLMIKFYVNRDAEKPEGISVALESIQDIVHHESKLSAVLTVVTEKEEMQITIYSSSSNWMTKFVAYILKNIEIRKKNKQIQH